jgi:hypothetical protein
MRDPNNLHEKLFRLVWDIAIRRPDLGLVQSESTLKSFVFGISGDYRLDENGVVKPRSGAASIEDDIVFYRNKLSYGFIPVEEPAEPAPEPKPASRADAANRKLEKANIQLDADRLKAAEEKQIAERAALRKLLKGDSDDL